MDVAQDGDARGAREEWDAAGGAVDFCACDIDDDEEEDNEEGGGVGGIAEGVEEELDGSVDHLGRVLDKQVLESVVQTAAYAVVNEGSDICYRVNSLLRL